MCSSIQFRGLILNKNFLHLFCPLSYHKRQIKKKNKPSTIFANGPWVERKT